MALAAVREGKRQIMANEWEAKTGLLSLWEDFSANPECGILVQIPKKKELQPVEPWAVSGKRGKENCSLPLKQRDFQLLKLQSDAKSSSGCCQQNVD